jgi:hypothetical protein
MLMAVALEVSDCAWSNGNIHVQAASKKYPEDANLLLPMQIQRIQLRQWNHYYNNIQRGVNSRGSDRESVDIDALLRKCGIPDRLDWYTLKNCHQRCDGS